MQTCRQFFEPLYLYACFNQHGSSSGLDDAIALKHNALELHPKGSPDCAFSLGHLAYCLHAQFKHSGTDNVHDLQETFNLYSQLTDIPQTVSYEVLIWVKHWIVVVISTKLH